MNTLLYLCYGPERNFEEARFSILSSFCHDEPDAQKSYQIVVYTDDPEWFDDLGVTTVTLSQALLQEWLGGSDYIHRRKTMTVIAALERFGESVAFIDCDTYFMHSPELIFTLVGPGRCCMHLVEGRLRETGTLVNLAVSELVRNHSFFDRQGRPLEISVDARMWNSGVIGIHASDAHLIHEALNLSDQMWPLTPEYAPGKKPHHIEQFATGHFLERLRLSECDDIVYHYWPEYLRNEFSKKVGSLVHPAQGVALQELAEMAYRERPQADFLRKVKMNVRCTLRQVGIRVPGVRNSA